MFILITVNTTENRSEHRTVEEGFSDLVREALRVTQTPGVTAWIVTPTRSGDVYVDDPQLRVIKYADGKLATPNDQYTSDI